jgi:hypothetical protein
MRQLMDVVVPVHAPDLHRLGRYCLPSVLRNLRGVNTISVVVTDNSFEEAAELCSAFRDVKVLHASELVPALGSTLQRPRARAGLATAQSVCALLRRVGRDVRYTPALIARGWFHQQVVKLAYADFTSATHYLAIDADMICARETHVDELVVDGRPIAQLYDRIPPNQDGWYRWAATLLGTVSNPAQALAMPPFIFVSAEVNSLLEEVNRTAPNRRLVDLIELLVLGIPSERPSRRWDRLLMMLPWTEYSLYHTHLLKAGRLQDVYETKAQLSLLGRAVWTESDLIGWEGIASAAVYEGFVFTLVQPSLGDQSRLLEREFPWLGR